MVDYCRTRSGSRPDRWDGGTFVVLRVGTSINNFAPGPGPDPGSYVEVARHAEALGYDSIWVGDHLLFHVPVDESLTVLATAAAVTERISIGSAILLATLRDPAWLAKTTATLQRVADGRLILGLGVGGEYPAEFHAVGVPVQERGARTDEMMSYLRAAWSGQHDQHRPVRYRLPEEPLRPGLETAVPLWIGGRSAPARERAARLGDGWLPAFMEPDRLREEVARYRGAVLEAGRGPGTVAFHVYVRVGDSVEQAWQDARGFLARTYDTPGDRLRPHCVTGPADECARRLDEYVAAGADHLILRIAGTDAHEQLERLAPAMDLVRDAASRTAAR